MARNSVDVWQGGLAFVGITVGVIPLLQVVFTGETGSLWQLLPGGGGGAPALVAVVVVLVGTLVGLTALERAKRHRAAGRR